MDPLPRRRKEGGGEIVEVYGFAGWIASLVAYGALFKSCKTSPARDPAPLARYKAGT